ncbi:MAG TPA: tetratricopeptide repeat protein [Vicinamibacterales bacterium]|nr:tetratricopeptide repeat protein [Vicinamibacterales bacterium]
MPFDREETLKKAEKLLRQGRLEAAITEYVRVVEEQPKDWNTTNLLGDLYVRAGQAEKAAEQYRRIADHFGREGFYPKAAALYKKILKFRPDDEGVLLELAEVSTKQGLLADAKAQFSAVAERRRQRGDTMGAAEIVVRLGSLDPSDIDARLNAARALAEGGSASIAAERYRGVSADLFEKNREQDALAALREAVRLNPADVGGRTQLARAYLGRGDVASAREFLTVETAADDPGLLVALVEMELREQRLEAAAPIVARVLELDPSKVNDVINVGWSFCQSYPEGAFLCVDKASDVAIAQKDFQTAASMLQEYIARATLQVPALLKLVEVCVDGGLEATMYETQAQLCDAYLASERASEARVISEDLVAREPWEGAHIERFRQALVMLHVSDPDTVIAERLNGQVPFVATDHFMDGEPTPAETMVSASEQEPTAQHEEEPVTEVPPGGALAAPPATPPAAGPSKEGGDDEGGEEVDMDALRAMLREVEGGDAASGASEVDLTSALLSFDSGAIVTPPRPAASLDEVFANARDQVSRQPGAEEAAEQLKLGKTCLGMGMVEEAVRALELAARSPRHRFEAASALGRLYQQKNETALAVEWMERAAEAPAPSAEEGRSLLYDLGVILEQTGETARALAVFLELLADAGTFRDVQARVDRLSRVETGS